MSPGVISAAAALTAALSASLAKIDQLVELVKKKEEMIRADNIEGLKEVLEQEEEMMSSVREMDLLREQKSKELARALDLKDEDAPLGDLIAALGDTPQAANLSRLRDSLRGSLAVLDNCNTRVRQLLELKKEYTDYMLNLLRSPERRSGTYSQTGQPEDDGDGGRRLVDIHV